MRLTSCHRLRETARGNYDGLIERSVERNFIKKEEAMSYLYQREHRQPYHELFLVFHAIALGQTHYLARSSPPVDGLSDLVLTL